MAWTTMHFAVGMGCAGVVAGCACTILKRGWRWLPVAMTVGGVWSLIPDMPRILREDLPFASPTLTHYSKVLEATLHDWGNLFFFHKSLDAQPNEFALHGLILILLLYNAAIVLLMGMESRARHSLVYRASRNHTQARLLRRRQADSAERKATPAITPASAAASDEALPNPVIGRIRSSHFTRVS